MFNALLSTCALPGAHNKSFPSKPQSAGPVSRTKQRIAGAVPCGSDGRYDYNDAENEFWSRPTDGIGEGRSLMIRDASLKDSVVFSNIISASFRDVAQRFSLTWDNCPKHPSYCTSSWIEADIDRGFRFFILDHDGTSIGCVGIENPGRDVCYLERLSVLPDMRGKHFGVSLVRHALAYAASSGAGKVGIGILSEQTELKDWYKHLGFTEVGTKGFPHLPFQVCFMEMEL